jgi:hypothetical protein
MLAADAILRGSPDDARRAAEADHVSYVAICGRITSIGAVPAAGSLWGELDAGRIPAWLEAIPGGAEGQFRVFRVRARMGG